MPRFVYTEEQKQFIYDNYKGILVSELQERFNERFGTELTQQQLADFKKHNKLRSGVDTRKKPAKIGHKILNRGRIRVKVADGTYKFESYINYEKAHGKVPDNHVLIHLDGNKLNTDASNLKAIPKTECFHMIRNNMLSNVPEITEINCTLAKLQCAKFKVRNKLKGKK